MPFIVPQAQFDAALHARRSLMAANNFELTVLTLFVQSYHEFWGVSDPPTGSIYTVEQMQAKIDAIGFEQTIAVLTAAAGMVAFINQVYPGAVAAKYSTAAFTYTVDQTGLHITGLADHWAVPPEPELEPEPTPQENPE
jgi:hypothetical protein